MAIKTRFHTLTIDDNGDTTDMLDTRETSTGSFLVDSAFVGATVGFTAAVDSGETFYVVNGSNGAPLSVTLTDGTWHPIPAGAMAFRYIKLVSASSETNGPETITVVTKES